MWTKLTKDYMHWDYWLHWLLIINEKELLSLFAVTGLQSKQIGAWPVLEIVQEKATLFLTMSSALYLSFNLLTKGREYNACEIFNFSIFPVH